jgi:DNA segregation ATPase FtsK/SpoIIIE, S-DNA-T family
MKEKLTTMYDTKFYRPARAYPPRLPEGEIVIDAPPVISPMRSGAMTWLQYLFPVVGGMGSFLFILAFHSNLLFVIAAVAIAVCAVGAGIAMGIVQGRMQKKQHKTERAAYLNYLTHCRTQLHTLAQMQLQVNTRLHPDSMGLVARIIRREYLWERRPIDEDFLHVRVGVGATPLSCDVRLDLGNSPMMVKFVPDLRLQAEALVDAYKYRDDIPIALPLRHIGTLAVTGSRSLTHSLVRAMLCQVVAFHSPEDVRCIVCFPRQTAQDWTWLKWLPHVRRLRQVKAEKKHAAESFCLLADNIDDCRDLLGNQIKPELERRRRVLDDKQETATNLLRPHLLVILDGFTPNGALARLPELDELFRDAAKLGATVICLVEDKSQEPSLTSARIAVSAVDWLSFEENKPGGCQLVGVTPDTIDLQSCEYAARSLAPLTLAEKGAQHDLSQDIRLLDLLSISSADDIHVPQRWQQRMKQGLLQVPIGRRADGEPLILDLKEAAEKGMGPHGLIVGATGSGKSELLRTIVSSLAITHDPSQVNFVLVDFKGGASFADFATLPHVAGVITNLESDAALVDRAYLSLLGEQQRRQRKLREAGNLDNIQQYQAKWQINPDMEPMPHLLIIIDEFAELVANRPDFLDLFVTTGRVGRSLGLHLLLASQRIDEGRVRGLEGHLRYRICLRTFSAQESSAVLGTPDAFYLPSSPGIGYFKVDADIFELFKTALISVPYTPATEHITPISLIQEFTSTGKLIRLQSAVNVSSSLSAPTKTGAGELHTEMDVIITHLAGLQPADSRARVHQIWLPPLSKMLALEELLGKHKHGATDENHWQGPQPSGTLCIPIGLVDKPLEQAQELLMLDFSGAGGHLAVVGAPQSGKSTLLRTIVASFMVTHTPVDVQLYCIDLGGGMLRVFENTPHVGAVCSKSERDKIRRVVRQMHTIIDERTFLFREQGIDSMATYRQRRQAGELSEVPFGDVFLIIDNFAQLQQEFDPLNDEITDIVATGLSYGVHVILATNRWAEMRPKLRDNIGTRLELRLNDPIESEFGKAAASAIPVSVPGRGLTKDKLQFQTALPWVGSHIGSMSFQNLPLQQALESLVRKTQQAWKAAPAPRIRMLPSLVTVQDLPRLGIHQPPGIPIGLEEFRLDPVYIDLISAGPHFIVLGDTECGKTNLLRTWMRGLEQRYTSKQVAFAIIDYRKVLLDFANSKHLLTYAHNPPTLKECVGNFKADLEKRLLSSSDIPLKQLRRQEQWNGCHYFLFADDYDSLITPAGSPLNPLVEFLLAGRDIGFHLVITRRVGGVGRTGFEPVFQRLKEMGSSGIIMSGDSQEGVLLGGQRANLLPPGRGYLIQRNHPPTLVQTLLTEPIEAEGYEKRAV